MADKDPNLRNVDDRDQAYYDQVFQDQKADQDPSIRKVDDRDQAYYDQVYRDRDADTPDPYQEEYAAEAIDPNVITRRGVDDDVGTGAATGMGWLALALSIIGLFFLPIVMGIAGIIVGFIARAQGARGLGAWAIGIGVAVIVLRLIAIPLL